MVSSSSFAGETIVYDKNDSSMLGKDPLKQKENSLFPTTSVSDNRVTVSSDVAGHVFGGVSTGSGAVSDNIVTIDGGAIGNSIYGGGSNNSDVTGNTVIFNGGTVGLHIYGGNSNDVGAVTNNTVKIGSGVKIENGGYIYGGNSYSGTATGNTVMIGSGATIGIGIYGGTSNSGAVTDNKVIIGSNATVSRAVYGGEEMGIGKSVVSRNMVEIGSGAIIGSSVFGGRSGSGDNIGNTVTLNGGTVNGDIYGGYAGSGTVKDNTVVINGGTVSGDVIGGYSSSTGAVTGNTVIVTGNSDISAARLIGGYGKTSSDNTLQFRSAGLEAKNISRFQNLQFILPNTVGNGDTILTLNGGTQTDISNSKISVAIASGPTALQAGNTITLLKNAVGIDKTGVTQTAMTGVQGISLDYEFKVNLDPADPDSTKLTATILGAQVNKASNIFSTGRLGTVSFLNQGADFALGAGLKRAMDITRQGGIGVFGAVGGSDMRYDTGSGSSSKAGGSHFLVGVAGKLDKAKDVDVIGSAYVEAGWGDVNGHNAVTSANGDTHYYGLGLIMKYRQNEGRFNGVYGQVNARIGKASTSYNSQLVSAEGNRGSFDKETTYYGAGLSVGYLKELTPAYSLDFSAEYLWTHLNGYKAEIAKDPYRFDDIDSHRTKVGARLNHTASQQFIPYIGVAWEHEFSGKANGRTYELSLEELSLKGDSGIVELGVNFKPENTSRLSFDANVSGYFGQREGVAGKMLMNYAF